MRKVLTANRGEIAVRFARACRDAGPASVTVYATGELNALHVRTGYGFRAEHADFAAAVLDTGLTWIGPPPAAIEALGDKVRARHIARSVGAPLVPGRGEISAVTP